MELLAVIPWQLLLAIIERLAAIWASSHAVLTKRETRAATGWVGLIWLAPVLGSAAYVCFGINRLRRRGGDLQQRLEMVLALVRPSVPRCNVAQLETAKENFPSFRQMTDLVQQLTGHELLPGNSVRCLQGGEQAYPEMLAAIREARQSVALQSYIFDNDRAGQMFIEALRSARDRGVEVRVLIDDMGSRYTRPSAVRVMRSAGIECRTFLPTYLPSATFYSNLRNHRKLLIVDGSVSFTGGMNIRESCHGEWKTAEPIRDLHFRLAGPVTQHLQEAFATDWCFAAGEVLTGERWFPLLSPAGSQWCRGITDGPDEDFEKLKFTILAAISLAQQRILIATPYFLPDESIIAALNVAALRGVQVRILIPERNNIRLVQWAALALLPQVLERGCEVFLTPLPFDHSKLLLIDHHWSLIGSTNWDPRSLRLNFEFNVECYGTDLNQQLAAIFEQQRQRSRAVTAEELSQRHLLLRLRDGIARLASPYI